MSLRGGHHWSRLGLYRSGGAAGFDGAATSFGEVPLTAEMGSAIAAAGGVTVGLVAHPTGEAGAMHVYHRFCGQREEAVASMRAIMRRRLFDRLSEEATQATPLDLFSAKPKPLRPDVTERRESGRGRRSDFIKQVTLNASRGGKFDVAPPQKGLQFGTLRAVAATRVATAAQLRTSLQKATDAVALCSESRRC